MFNIIIILLYILFGVLAWKNFKFALYSVFLLLPTYRVQFEILGLPFNLLSGIIWVLVLIWIIRNYKRIFTPFVLRTFPPKIGGKHLGLRLSIILILISAFVSIFFATDFDKALGLFRAYFLEALFFFVLLVFNFRNSKEFKNCIYALQILLFLIFTVAVYQKLTGCFIFNTTNIIEQGRITTLFGYPNANGLLLLPIFFLTFINLLKDKKTWLKLFSFLTLIFSVVIIYWARSESALIAIIIGLILFGLFKLIRCKKSVLCISLLIVLIALILPFITKVPEEIDEPNKFQYTLKQKLLMQDLSGQIRRQMWHETIEFVKERPFFGSGLVGYQQKVEPYHKFSYIEIFLYPHNIFLNFWVSLGIFGLIGFLGLIVLFIIKLTKNLSKENLILLIAFLAIITQGIVEVPYFKNDLSIIWWLIIAGYLVYKKA